MGSPINSEDRLWRHRFAILTAICTFPLIFAGGLVTSTGSALAVPDWPTSYGYNMFTFPPSKWNGGIFYEHTHRLIGSVVGMLTVVLALWMGLREPRRSARWMALGAVIGVMVQGVVGGMRVTLVNHVPSLAAQLPIVHACLAQAFFGLMVSLALITSPGWEELGCGERAEEGGKNAERRIRFLAIITSALIYLQIFLGALTRHQMVGAAAHIVVAFLVVAAVVWVFSETINHVRGEPRLTRTATLLLGLVIGQLLLGFAAWIVKSGREEDLGATRLQALIPTAHVALGALLFATSIILILFSFRILRTHQSASFPPPLATPAQSKA